MSRPSAEGGDYALQFNNGVPYQFVTYNAPNYPRTTVHSTAIYGAEAANLALKYLALGGVYVCGGIAPKILPALQTGGFIRAFLDKGRLRATLEQIPVRVCLNEDAALIGAAHVAAAML